MTFYVLKQLIALQLDQTYVIRVTIQLFPVMTALYVTQTPTDVNVQLTKYRLEMLAVTIIMYKHKYTTRLYIYLDTIIQALLNKVSKYLY